MPESIAAGRLDRDIVIQRATIVQDETTGQDVPQWDAGQTVAAQWLPSTATETWQARQVNSSIQATYRTYFQEAVTPDAARIVGHDGRLYDVVGVTEEGRRQSLLIHVVARGEAP